jgi:integrase/recombinase XerC
VYSIRDGRSTGCAAATVNRRMAAVSGLFEFRAMRDPDTASPVPKGAGRRQAVRGERGGLLGHLATARPSSRVRDKAMAGLMLLSGLRSAEVLALRVGDVDIPRGWVLVTGKGDKERRVPVDAEVAGLIQAWR